MSRTRAARVSSYATTTVSQPARAVTALKDELSTARRLSAFSAPLALLPEEVEAAARAAASFEPMAVQTKGQLTTMLVRLMVRSPAFRACCSCSYERTRLGGEPAFQVTSTTAQRGG